MPATPEDTFRTQVIALDRPPVSSAELEAMGRSAATMHLNEGAVLSDVVPQVIRDSGHNLNPEQIDRVVEFANQQTHMGYLGKSQDYPEFDVAEPAAVHQQIASSVEPEQRTVDDYASAPPEQPAGDMPEYQGEADEHTKAAGQLATNELQRTKEALAGHADHVRHDLDRMISMHKQAKADFHREVRNFLLSEQGTLADVTHAVTSVGGGAFAKQAMAELTDWLRTQVPDGVIAGSLIKRASAGVVTDVGHPIVVTYSVTVKTARDVHRHRLLLDKLDSSAAKVKDAIKERIRG